MASITLNGTTFTGVDKYDPSFNRIVTNAFRDINSGEAKADFVADKVKIELKFRYRSESQAQAIKNVVTGAYFFPVVYDDLDGTQVSGTFYRGDFKATAVWYDPNTGQYKYDISFNIIEK